MAIGDVHHGSNAESPRRAAFFPVVYAGHYLVRRNCVPKPIRVQHTGATAPRATPAAGGSSRAIAVGCTGFPFWYRGLPLGGIGRVTQVQLLQIFLTLFASALLLNESVNATTIIFAVFVVGTIALSRRMPVSRSA